MRNLSLEKDLANGKKRELEEILERKEDNEEQLQKLAIRFNMLEVIHLQHKLSSKPVCRVYLPQS